MGKAKRRRRARFEGLEIPPPEQLANGSFEREAVTHAETNTKAMAYRRRGNILEAWIREGGPGFDHGAQRVIADCLTFWARIGEPKVTAHYGERLPASTDGEGYTRQEALDEIHFRRKLLPAGMDGYWSVFENVVRHNEPAGVAGSRFASNRPQQIQSAKVITGMVASFLAAKLGY